MSHHIYTTPGFVVDSRPHGEAGKFLYIFTRDLGMIGGVAQGIRLTQSKLRYHAQDFSLATFSLVRGKEIWRIVGAEEFPKLLTKDLARIPTVSPLFVRIMKTLKRLIAGEEKNEKLFETVISAYNFLSSTTHSEADVEYIIMLRILHRLGYVRDIPEFAVFLADDSFDVNILTAIQPLRSKAIKEINTALKESHL